MFETITHHKLIQIINKCQNNNDKVDFCFFAYVKCKIDCIIICN